MSNVIKKEDIRIVKTQKALYSTIILLLEKHSFKQITVNNICEEALVSRATFYSHFRDKYDLLDAWFTNKLKEYHNLDIKNIINSFIYNNTKLIRNILIDADFETMDIIHQHLTTLITRTIKANPYQQYFYEYQTFSHFCVGGMLHILALHLRDKFPLESNTTEKYFYELVEHLTDWNSKKHK